MVKQESPYGVLYSMTEAEAREVCRLGMGKETCAFLVSGQGGFECGRGHERIFNTISKRLSQGTMNAQAIGLWTGCAWEAR